MWKLAADPLEAVRSEAIETHGRARLSAQTPNPEIGSGRTVVLYNEFLVKHEKPKTQAIVAAKTALFRRDAHIFDELPHTVIGRSTVPLFKPRVANGVPDLIGTAVLFKIGDFVFLLTAAHVVEQFDGGYACIPHGERPMNIHGVSHRSRLPPSGIHDDDPHDYAVVRIDGEEADILRQRAITFVDLFLKPEPPLLRSQSGRV
jgi:hypothetical protein